MSVNQNYRQKRNHFAFMAKIVCDMITAARITPAAINNKHQFTFIDCNSQGYYVNITSRKYKRLWNKQGPSFPVGISVSMLT